MHIVNFRAWDKVNKQYVYWKDMYGLERWSDSWGGDRIAVHVAIADQCYLFPDNMILEQCTGLTDKDDTPIWEGDIIEFDPREWGRDKGNRWPVIWDEQEGCWDLGGGGPHRSDRQFRKVIGNIHEYPKLLRPPETPKPLDKHIGSAGGKARAAALTPERRKEIAVKAAQTRWRKIK